MCVCLSNALNASICHVHCLNCPCNGKNKFDIFYPCLDHERPFFCLSLTACRWHNCHFSLDSYVQHVDNIMCTFILNILRIDSKEVPR